MSICCTKRNPFGHRDGGYLLHLPLHAKVLKYCLRAICKCPNTSILFPGGLELLLCSVTGRYVIRIKLRNPRNAILPAHAQVTVPHLHRRFGNITKKQLQKLSCYQPGEMTTTANQQVWRGAFFVCEPCKFRNSLGLKLRILQI